MTEVGGALVAIALVLCSVFIPTAFISGITGTFFRQFALTIAVSTAISALNSLDAFTRTRRASPPAARRGEGFVSTPARRPARMALQRIQQNVCVELERLRQHRRASCPTGRHRSVHLRRFTWPDRSRFQSRAGRFSSDAGSRLRRRLCAITRRGVARSHPGRRRQDFEDRARNARRTQHGRVRRIQSFRRQSDRTRPPCSCLSRNSRSETRATRECRRFWRR